MNILIIEMIKKTMQRTHTILFLITLLVFAQHLQAQDSGLDNAGAIVSTNAINQCVSATASSTASAQSAQPAPLYFFQHTFEDNMRDLALTQTLPASDIKRVTFNHSQQSCPYQALAIAEGANVKEHWGWHLAWADTSTIYYARLDDEAWVSSVPKKISAKGVHALHFMQTQDLLNLSWKNANGESDGMQSDDEGRSWSEVSPR